MTPSGIEPSDFPTCSAVPQPTAPPRGSPKQVRNNNTAVTDLLEQKRMHTDFQSPVSNSVYVRQTTSPTKLQVRLERKSLRKKYETLQNRIFCVS